MTPEERAERAAEQLVHIRSGDRDVSADERVNGRVFVVMTNPATRELAYIDDDSDGEGMKRHGQQMRDAIAAAMAGVIREAVIAEREACAQLADAAADSPDDREAGAALTLARAIRARGAAPS